MDFCFIGLTAQLTIAASHLLSDFTGHVYNVTIVQPVSQRIHVHCLQHEGTFSSVHFLLQEVVITRTWPDQYRQKYNMTAVSMHGQSH